jgi:hypothetical protein
MLPSAFTLPSNGPGLANTQVPLKERTPSAWQKQQQQQQQQQQGWLENQ